MVVATMVAVAVLAVRAAWIDIREHRIPNPLVLACYPIVLVGLVAVAFVGRPSWLAAAFGAVAWAAPIGLLWLLGGRTGMGPGDVKLAIPLGATLGWLAPHLAVIGIAIAFVAGGCFALALMARHGSGVRVAFGPFMVAGWVIAQTPLLLPSAPVTG